MAIDPIASCIDALATHLTTALGASASAVLRGWPESGVELDLDGAAVVAITAIAEERAEVAPRVVETSGTTYTYKVAELTVRLQIDVWARHRAVLDAMGPTLRAAFSNALPRAGLWLTQSDYYSRPVCYFMEAGALDLDGDSAAQGEWRRTYSVTATTDEVASTTHVALSQLDVTITTTDVNGNGDVAETFTVIED